MLLRNKITGEVKEFVLFDGKNELQGGATLKDLMNEWEDYKEPEIIWYLDWKGRVQSAAIENNWEKEKSIGNYFETKKEAEKAVEKLKAWKRLKDKGISFEVKVIDRKWYLEPKANPQQRTFDEAHDLFKDIMFIFWR